MKDGRIQRFVFCLAAIHVIGAAYINPAKKISTKLVERDQTEGSSFEAKRSLDRTVSSGKIFDFCRPTDLLAGDAACKSKAVVQGALVIHEGPLLIQTNDSVWDIDCSKNCGIGDVKKDKKKLSDLVSDAHHQNDDEPPLSVLQKSLVEINQSGSCERVCAQPVALSCDTLVDVPQTKRGSYRVIEGCFCNFDPRHDVFLVKFDRGCLRAPGAMMDLMFQTVIEPNLSAWVAQGCCPFGVVRPMPIQISACKQLVHPSFCKDTLASNARNVMTCKQAKSFAPRSFETDGQGTYYRVNARNRCVDTCSLTDYRDCNDCTSVYGREQNKNFAELALEYRPVDCGRPEWVSFTFYPRQDFCVYGLKSEVTRSVCALSAAELAGEVMYTQEQLQACPRSFFKIQPGTLYYRLISSNMLTCFGAENPTVVDVMKCDIDLACCLGNMGVDEECFRQICDILKTIDGVAYDAKKFRSAGNYLAKYEPLFRQAANPITDSEMREKVYQAIVRTYQRRALDLSLDDKNVM